MSRLNGKILVEEGIVTKVPEKNIQQVGCDLNLIKVEQLVGIGGIIDTDKTTLPTYRPVALEQGENGVMYWNLVPGVYGIIFEQGCNIPNDVYLKIRQRSSVLRCGATIQSSIFDPGFFTDNMGCFMTVNYPISIAAHARVAQIYGTENKPVSEDKMYNGQFQGK